MALNFLRSFLLICSVLFAPQALAQNVFTSTSVSFTAICGASATGELLFNNSGTCDGITGWTTNGTTAITGGASTTLAIGGATIGTHALAVTGTAEVNGTLSTGANNFILSDYGRFANYLAGSLSDGTSGGVFRSSGYDPTNFGVFASSDALIGFSSTTSVLGSPDVILRRDAANTLGLRNGGTLGAPVAQQINSYTFWADASNYEGAYLTSAVGSVTLGARTAGTGTNDIDVNITPVGTGVVRANTSLATPGINVNSDGLMAHLIGATYTPALTNVANLDGSTAFSCQYMRIGDVINGSCKVSVDPTTTLTLTTLGIALPVASDFQNDNEAAGTCFASGIAAQGAAILADVANNRLSMTWISGDVTNQPMFCTFTYRVI